MTIQQKQSSYVTWFCIVLFFCYQYLLRVIPGVMVSDLRSEFNITAEQFGTLGAFYLYIYSLMQIPIGIVTDRIGVKNTVLGSILLCLIGAFMLAITKSFEFAQLSRVLMGAGSACAFMGCLKVVSDNFPPGKRGFLMGATLTFGTLGALSAGAPLTYLINHFGWRHAIFVLAALGVVIFLITLFGVSGSRDLHKLPPPLNASKMKTDVLSVLKNKSIMLYAFLAIALYTPLSVVSDLWGVAFFMEKHGFPRAEAAQICMYMYAGLCVGSLFMTWWAEKYNVLNLTIQICSMVILVLFVILIFGPVFSQETLSVLVFSLGLACGAEMLCFAGVALYANKDKIGVTLGVANTLNMLGGAILQQGIGIILDILWSGKVDTQGLRVYSTADYQAALSILLAVIAICCCVAFLLPRQRKSAV